MTKEIKGFITILGAEIIAVLGGESDDVYMLEHAFFLAPIQGEDGKAAPPLAPLSHFGSGNVNEGIDFPLQKQHVLAVHDLHEKVIEIYENIINPHKIQVADTSAIVSLDAARNTKK